MGCVPERLHLFPREGGCRGRHGEAAIVTPGAVIVILLNKLYTLQPEMGVQNSFASVKSVISLMLQQQKLLVFNAELISLTYLHFRFWKCNCHLHFFESESPNFMRFGGTLQKMISLDLRKSFGRMKAVHDAQL